MHRLLQILAVATLTCCWLMPASGQTPGADPGGVLDQLLLMPAPTPRTAATPTDGPPNEQRPPKFFAPDTPPPDDAPIEDILAYWNRWVDTHGRPAPSEAVKQRLFEACIGEPEILSRFLPFLPSSEAVGTRVKQIFDNAQANQSFDENWRDQVKKWLVFNTRYFLSELIALAQKVKDADKGGYVEKQDALVALAKVDWPAAEPVLRSLAGGSQPRASALALVLFYQHAISENDSDGTERYRNSLKTIAADRSAPGQARDAAIEALSLSEWSGRDEWYLSLFEDESLISPSDGSYGFSPLTTLFAKDPDKWIPIMTRLVESKNFNIRSGAASCLIIFQNQRARKDALKPLLPWLSNPAWAKDSHSSRLRLIQSMENVDMPESVPGLIWTIEHSTSEDAYERSYAAESLAKYKDPRGVPALRKALLDEKDETHRHRIITGLVACGGLSEEEQLDAIEAYAAKMTTAEGQEEVQRYRGYGDKPLPVPVSIGKYLASEKTAPGSLVTAVLARATKLQKSNPRLAQSLLEVGHQWQSRQIDLDLIERIAAGTADAKLIANALSRRDKLRESGGPELQGLTAADGPAPGVGAVLLDDAALIHSVLSSGSEPARIAVLACARLTQSALPVEVVGGLMSSKNRLLALAAERYLLAEDSKEARELLWRKHPNEGFITGWRENIELIGGHNFDLMAKVEEKLRGELLKADPPLEIIALIVNSQRDGRVLRIYPDRAVYTYYEDLSRYHERTVTPAELAAFKQFLTTQGIAETGPQFSPCHHDCWSSQFLQLTKSRGRRVFSHQGAGAWSPLLANFARLGQGEGARVHYNLEREIKGLEVLYADDQLVVRDVWQQGEEVRIFVEREETDEEIEQRNTESAADEEAEVSRAERRRREIARSKRRFSWRKLTGNRADNTVDEPAGYSRFDFSRFPAGDDDDEYSTQIDERQVQRLTDDSIVIAKNFDGLWRQTAGQKPVRISGEDGAYANPIVTPDRKWVVVAKTDSNWATPNYVVRVDLQTGREHRVNLEPADQFDPVAFVATHKKILVRRSKDEEEPQSNKTTGPDRPEYHLIDPATGETQRVSGEFEPLHDIGKRFLQPTGKVDEFWAAISNREQNRVEVGRYSLKDFTFQKVIVLPHITFDSMSMWVDEAGSKLYVVYQGQLLRLPLSPN